jgi:hypothetical protein
MFYKFFKICFLTLLLAICINSVSAQDNSRKINDPNAPEKNSGLRETLAKWRIKKENEKFEELVKRGEEASKISEELKASFEQSKKLTSEEIKKLDKLEKLVKKILDELGADDDSEDFLDSEEQKNVNSLESAINFLQETSSNLLKELKKNTKHTVSTIAIESSNYIMKIVKFIRLKRN